MGEHEKARRIVRKVFTNGPKFWNPIERVPAYVTLSQRLLERYYRGKPEWFNEDVGKFLNWSRQNLPTLSSKDASNWKIGKQKFPAWPRFLQGGLDVRELRSPRIWSIVHGDLNPNSIIVSDDDGIALIDFRDAGVGHCHEDPVTLEACIRSTWPWQKEAKLPEQFLDIIEIEVGKRPARTDLDYRGGL